MTRCLVLVNSFVQAEDVSKHISSQRDSDTKFIYPLNIGLDRARFDNFLRDCADTIHEEEIETTVCFHPENHMIQTMLIKQFPHLNGPSFESVMLCLHKFYTWKVLLSGMSLKFSFFEVEDAKIQEQLAVFEDIGETGIYMDAVKATTAVYELVRDNEDDFDELEMQRRKMFVCNRFDSYLPALNAFGDRGKYPFMFKPMSIISENWRDYVHDVTYHIVECCVRNDKEVIPWAIVDVILSKDEHRGVKYYSFPSTLERAMQHEIWGHVGFISQFLVATGFVNQFFNLFIMCTPSGGIRIIDLDCGCVINNGQMYRAVLNQGCPLRASVLLARSEGSTQIVREPKMNAQRHSIRAEIRSYHTTGTIDGIVDMRHLKSHSDMEWACTSFESRAKADELHGGQLLGTFHIHGKSLEDCLKQAEEKVHSILLPTSYTNWFIGEPEVVEVEPPKKGQRPKSGGLEKQGSAHPLPPSSSVAATSNPSMHADRPT